MEFSKQCLYLNSVILFVHGDDDDDVAVVGFGSRALLELCVEPPASCC